MIAHFASAALAAAVVVFAGGAGALLGALHVGAAPKKGVLIA